MVTMIEPSVHLAPGLSASDVELFEIDLWRFRGTLRPLATARGVLSERESIIVRVHADVAGFSVTGWGEAAPLPGWGTDTLSRVRFELSRVRDMVFAGAQADPITLLDGLECPTARFAFTSALLDAIAHARRKPLRHLIDPGAAHSISVNATVGLESIPRTIELARQAWTAGFRTLKLKAGNQEDVERASQVRKALPDMTLRLDANGSWNWEDALRHLEALEPLGIDYVEQPVSDSATLGELRARSPVAIAADESCLPIAAAYRLIDEQAVDVLVLKPALLGAWADITKLVATAHDAGLRVVFTSAIESTVGRTATAQIAAALLGGDIACGLATDWFERDVGAPQRRIREGRLYLGSGNGLGLQLGADHMKEFDP